MLHAFPIYSYIAISHVILSMQASSNSNLSLICSDPTINLPVLSLCGIHLKDRRHIWNAIRQQHRQNVGAESFLLEKCHQENEWE